MPRDLQAIARERVDGLSARGRYASLVAAAVSRPTRELILKAVAPEDDAGTGLLEAEEAGVLVTEAGRLRFTHPLLASALYGSATPERRRRLHEGLAAIVSDPEEQARHLALSTTEADERVAGQLEEAAGRAAKRGAQQAASDLYTGACRLTPAERSEELVRRELGQAAALLALGDLEGSLALAEDVVASGHTGPLRARALLLLGDIAWIVGRPDAIARLEQAVDAARGDSRLLAQVYSKLVNVSIASDPAGTLERARSAVETLDPDRDSAALGIRCTSTGPGPRHSAATASSLSCFRSGVGARNGRGLTPRRGFLRAHLLPLRRRLRCGSRSLRGRGTVVSRARRGHLVR